MYSFWDWGYCLNAIGNDIGNRREAEAVDVELLFEPRYKGDEKIWGFQEILSNFLPDRCSDIFSEFEAPW